MSHMNDSQGLDEVKNLRNRISELEREQDSAVAQLVLQHIKDAVIVLDAELRIVSWNNAAETLYGWSASEVQGQRMVDILPPIRIQNDLAMHDLVARLYQFSRWRGEMVYFDRSGHNIVVEASIHLLPSKPGSPGGLLHIHHDLTEFRQLEQQRDKIQFARNRTLAEQELLSSIATTAAGESNIERMLKLTLDKLSKVIQFTGGSIALVESDELVVRAAFGPFASTALGQRMARGRSRSWQVIETGDPYLCNDLLALGLSSIDSKTGTAMQSYLAVPLSWRGHVFGLLEIDSTQVNAFYPPDLALLQSVAASLSGPLEMVRRHSAEVQTLNAAEATQRRYSDLLEGLEAIVWEAEPETFQVTFVNPWAEKLLGYPLERWLSEPDFWLQLIHPDDHERVLLQVRQSIRMGKDYDLQYRVVAADGHVIWLRDMVDIVRDSAGQTHCLRGVMMDITRQKQTEDALREALQRLTFHMGNSPLGLIEWDPNFRITRWSEGAERIFGWELQDVVGQRFDQWQFVFEDDLPEVTQLINEMATGERQRAVILNRQYTKSGAVIFCEWYSSALLDEQGKLISVFSQVLDVTERQRLEAELKEAVQANARLYREAEEAVRARDQFLSIAAHELKTPITTILGNAELLRRRAEREGGAAERDDRALRALAEQAQRLSRLSLSLLELSRIEAGQLLIERKPMDLRQLMQRIVAEFDPGSERHTLTWSGPDSPVMVEGDELRLEQVTQSLLQNAVKYSPDGGPIRITLALRDGEVQVSVADHGLGIPEAALPHLFSRFFRAGNVDAKQIVGMGLGLYLVKAIVAQHGGTVSADSVEGEGSTFRFCLPLLGPTAN